jgi:hypothetical protein
MKEAEGYEKQKAENSKRQNVSEGRKLQMAA